MASHGDELCSSVTLPSGFSGSCDTHLSLEIKSLYALSCGMACTHSKMNLLSINNPKVVLNKF